MTQHFGVTYVVAMSSIHNQGNQTYKQRYHQLFQILNAFFFNFQCRYMLQTQIADHTGSTVVVMFDKIAEKIIGQPIQTLIQLSIQVKLQNVRTNLSFSST